MVEEMKRFKHLVFPCAQFMKRENKRDILYVEQENYVGIEEIKESSIRRSNIFFT